MSYLIHMKMILIVHFGSYELRVTFLTLYNWGVFIKKNQTFFGFGSEMVRGGDC